jgi:aryl-alcohol dehydrogenase-like predicted oxidoreductase
LGTGVRGPLDEARYERTVRRAIDLGCNFLDCANVYAHGRSETLLGRAIAGLRDDLVITSKVCSPVGTGLNDRGLSRYHILREVERSLRALDTDRIDIYYLHNVDPETRIEETLRTIVDLVRQGKVRYAGASNYDGAQVVELLWTADRLGLEPIVCLQNQYNLLHRRPIEADLLPVCRRHGLGLITYSPLAIGLLSGRYRRGAPPPADSPLSAERLDEMLSERGDAVVRTLIDLAAARGATPAQMAIAWILDHPEVTAPIVGADRPEYVDDVFGALEITLTVEERETLDAASQWDEPGRYL